MILGKTDLTALNELPEKSFEINNVALTIGQDYAFNSLYFYLAQKSKKMMPFMLDFWDGVEWLQVVDVLDGTMGFMCSGEIKVIYDQDQMKRMKRADSDEIGLEIEGNKVIRDKYWIRFHMELPTFEPEEEEVFAEVRKVGIALTDYSALKDEFPNVDTYLGTFGQEDWSSQIMAASDEAIDSLKNDEIIRSKEQLLDTREWRRAVAYRALAKIYENIGGEEMITRAEMAERKYKSMIRNKTRTIDLNNDGIVQDLERNRTRISRFTR